MKIVGVGLNKTGTKTLGTCLRTFGLKHSSTNYPAFQLWRLKRMRELMVVVGAFDSFEDWPWPLIYREIDAAYPGTKFILTTRDDPEVWFRSLCDLAKRTGPTEYREVIYGHAMPEGHKEAHIRIYLEHNQAVRDHFKDRPDALLEVCWERGDAWAELAGFIGRPAPDSPFPHENRTSDTDRSDR